MYLSALLIVQMCSNFMHLYSFSFEYQMVYISPFIISCLHLIFQFLYVSWKWKWSPSVAQSCPTLCDPGDCSLPGSSVHGILQARILEWVAISFSRGSSQPRDGSRVSHIGGRHFHPFLHSEVFSFSFSFFFGGGVSLFTTLVFKASCIKRLVRKILWT